MQLEGKTTEFKREFTDDLKYAVIAFANTDGGKIYIGVNDDGSVRGVQNADETILRITNMIRDVVRPNVTMFTECFVEEIEGQSVVVVSVQRGTARQGPTICTARGFVRRACTSGRELLLCRRPRLRS